MEILFTFIIVAAICILLAVADIAFSRVMYLVYLYDGGKRSYKWYCKVIENSVIEW